MSTKRKASIIIANWNGKHLLQDCLPSVIGAVGFDKGKHEIIVVDDGSTDGSVKFVRSKFPHIRLIPLKENIGFTRANNLAAAKSKNELLAFLNNDVIVKKDFLAPLLKHFDDEKVFAVTSKILMPKGKREETGLTRGRFKRGFIELWHERRKYSSPVPSLYAGGASSAVRKDRFLKLGGFDSLYEPFYYEDTDLSYRAWKRGWKVIYEPQSIVYHKHQATTKKFGAKVIKTAKERNKFLFIWKNVTDKRYLLSHLLWLPLVLSFSLVKLDFIEFLSFFRALKRLPRALQGRKKEREYIKYSDKKILEITSHPLGDQKEDRRSQKLNILFLSPYLPCTGIHAGAGRMFSLIRELSRRHNIYVLSFVTRKELAYVAKLKKYCQEVRTVLRKPYSGLDISSLIPSQIREYYSPAIHQEIKDFLETHEIDVISTEYILMSNYLVENHKSTLTLYQLNFLSYYRDWKRRNPFYRFFTFLPILKMLNYEIKISQRYGRVIMLTKYEKRILNLFAPHLKVEVIPIGVDKEYFSPRRVKESDDLIFIGYFLHSPNVDAMLYFCKSIYPLIKKELPKTRLQIIGYQPPPEIQALAQDKSITVTGHVKDLRSYLARSKVFINPVRLGAGMRGKVLEACAMAKSVVSTSIGCQGLEAIPGRHLFIADRPEVFASQTVRLLKDKKLRLKMGMAGRRLVESKYDWKVIAHELEETYQELVLEVSEF